MSAAAAQLVLASDRRRVAPLDAAQPLTIGRAAANRLCLTSGEGVAEHHAVVRFSRSHGWVVCDWKSEQEGTWLEGQRVHQCRPLNDGDEIRLGRQGPVLVFELTGKGAPEASIAPADPAPTPRAPQARPAPQGMPQPVNSTANRTLDVEGQSVAVAMIRSASVRSEALHPHIFSWWLLLCLGGLLLLPVPLLFWPLQVIALAGWILLGSRKQHTLVLELRDGRALRHRFANRRTALAHRNGIRKAIGQAVEPGGRPGMTPA
jgi:hypothetical protein